MDVLERILSRFALALAIVERRTRRVVAVLALMDHDEKLRHALTMAQGGKALPPPRTASQWMLVTRYHRLLVGRRRRGNQIPDRHMNGFFVAAVEDLC